MNRMSSCTKILFLPSLFILALLAVLVGCTQKTPTAAEIVNGAVASMSKINTYKYDLDMKTDFYRYDVIKNETGGENITAKDLTKVSGTLDKAEKEMHTTIDYSGSLLQGQIISKLPPLEFSMRPLFSSECFATSNESYVKFGVPPLPAGHWTKSGFNAWGYLDQAAQQIELLKTAAEVDFLGTGKMNGIDCYILKTTPDSEKLAEWLSRQLALTSLGNVQAKKEELLSFSIKLWIARDSYLLIKTEFELKQRQRNSESDKKGQLNFYDYNQTVSITIPPEASIITGTGTAK